MARGAAHRGRLPPCMAARGWVKVVTRPSCLQASREGPECHRPLPVSEPRPAPHRARHAAAGLEAGGRADLPPRTKPVELLGTTLVRTFPASLGRGPALG